MLKIHSHPQHFSWGSLAICCLYNAQHHSIATIHPAYHIYHVRSLNTHSLSNPALETDCLNWQLIRKPFHDYYCPVKLYSYFLNSNWIERLFLPVMIKCTFLCVSMLSMTQVLLMQSQTSYTCETISPHDFIKTVIVQSGIGHDRGKTKFQCFCFPALS